MAFTLIELERGPVSTITLNRPEKSNALNREMLHQLLQGFAELEEAPETKAVILKGSGKGFCAGADLTMMNSGQLSVLEKREILSLLPVLFNWMTSSKNIIIAQVHGYALAGGFGLALAADLTVCEDKARLGMPEIGKGLMPMNIMAPVNRTVPKKKLLEWMLTGREIPTEEALASGALNHVYPRRELEKKTKNLAEAMACHEGYALKFGKEAFYTIQDMPYEKCFPYLNDMLMMTVMAKGGDANETV